MSTENFDFYICSHQTDNAVAFQILDYLEKEDGLTGFHEERDGIPGRPVIVNTTDAIENSRYILILFSERSMEDGWFEMKVYSGLSHTLNSARRNRIIPVYIVPSSGEPPVPTCLNSIIGIEYRNEPVFFNKLSRIFQT